jgi:putative ABC transport system substrate-binding protein
MILTITRRQFAAALGVTAASSVVVRAQQPGTMRRIGVLMSGAESDPEMQAGLAAFRQGLERLGWFERRNLQIDYRFAGANAGRYQPLARELVSLQPEMIFARSTPIAVALKRETSTIPIVFVNVSDPVVSGLVASLGRPAGNITGLLLYEPSITGRWLSMLKELTPQLTRVALMGHPKRMPYDSFLEAAEAAKSSLGIEILPSRVETVADVQHSIDSLAKVPNSGLVVLADSLLVQHRDLVIVLASLHRLPTVYPFRYFVTGGGIMSYGTDDLEQHRQAATYVDRILRGAKPADLPVQIPTKYETVINVTTARALGFTVPPGLLVAADEVIE